MKSLINQIEDFKEKISRLQGRIIRSLEYKGKSFYKEKCVDSLVDADKSFKLIKKEISAFGDSEISSCFSKIEQEISIVLANPDYRKKLNSIKNLRLLWNDLEV